MTTLTGMNPVFEPVLAELSERHRDEVLAAFAAVEHSPEPVPEAQLLALRDATLRRSLDDLLHRVGRTLIPVGTAWTSGYRDDVAAELARAGWHSLPADRPGGACPGADPLRGDPAQPRPDAG